MRYAKWISGLLALLFVGLFIQYTLPGRDIVQIVGTDVKRMDIGSSALFWASPDATTNAEGTRDVRFINAVWPDGSPRVYRNEDTDWSWPPYFKFDSSNLTAQAQALAKKENAWVAVTHYGWRLEFFTVFPNAIGIREVSGPDATLIPWFNIAFFVVLAILLFFLFRAAQAFKRRNIDPMIENIDDMIEDIGDSADEAHAQAMSAKRNFIARMKRLFGNRS